jgi:hypothetical protein
MLRRIDSQTVTEVENRHSTFKLQIKSVQKQALFLDRWTLKAHGLRSFDKPVTIYQSKGRHIPEDLKIQQRITSNDIGIKFDTNMVTTTWRKST